MNHEKTSRPFVIAGTALLLCGLVFLVITLSVQTSSLWGAAIGCIGSCLPLLIAGLIQSKKAK